MTTLDTTLIELRLFAVVRAITLICACFALVGFGLALVGFGWRFFHVVVNTADSVNTAAGGVSFPEITLPMSFAAALGLGGLTTLLWLALVLSAIERNTRRPAAADPAYIPVYVPHGGKSSAAHEEDENAGGLNFSDVHDITDKW